MNPCLSFQSRENKYRLNSLQSIKFEVLDAINEERQRNRAPEIKVHNNFMTLEHKKTTTDEHECAR